MKNELTTSKIMQVLDWAYEKAVGVHGIKGLDTAQELAVPFMNTHEPLFTQVNHLIRRQNTKAGTAGFLTGLGGLVAMPITLPANITSVLYMQIRMVAAIAHMAGKDLQDPQVKTMVYVALCGSAVADVVKSTGIQLGTKLTANMVQKYLTAEVIKQINKAVGFRLVAQFSQKGLINVGKMVPLLGGVIGASFDAMTTNIIGNTARDLFIGTSVDVRDIE